MKSFNLACIFLSLFSTSVLADVEYYEIVPPLEVKVLNDVQNRTQITRYDYAYIDYTNKSKPVVWGKPVRDGKYVRTSEVITRHLLGGIDFPDKDFVGDIDWTRRGCRTTRCLSYYQDNKYHHLSFGNWGDGNGYYGGKAVFSEMNEQSGEMLVSTHYAKVSRDSFDVIHPAKSITKLIPVNPVDADPVPERVFLQLTLDGNWTIAHEDRMNQNTHSFNCSEKRKVLPFGSEVKTFLANLDKNKKYICNKAYLNNLNKLHYPGHKALIFSFEECSEYIPYAGYRGIDLDNPRTTDSGYCRY